MESPWPLGGVTLKVLDLEAQIRFYQDFGLSLLDGSESEASLGVGQSGLLRLRRLHAGSARPPRSAGLYHFALLVPDEESLGSFLVHAVAARLPFVGAGDHLVSQALYFEDPEGNGIEIYADRPRGSWTYENGRVRMATLPVDLDRLLALGRREWSGLPPVTVLGHMHLSVADLEASQAHYESLGMQPVGALGPFRFLSWDGYHHHLGINLLQGRGAAPVRPDSAGLEGFTIRAVAPGPRTVSDPDGIRVSIEAGTSARL